MTALKPSETRLVRGVAADRYPLNRTCAHPECSEPTRDPHHLFPRSMIGNDSWFVEIRTLGDFNEPVECGDVIPHVTGLCRSHHDDLELHRAWVRRIDGVFVWYDREPDVTLGSEWVELGPLNPQPAAAEVKKKRKRFTGEARRTRRTVSIKVPADREDGGAVWDEHLDAVKDLILLDPESPWEEREDIPNYEAVVVALALFLEYHRDYLRSVGVRA